MTLQSNLLQQSTHPIRLAPELRQIDSCLSILSIVKNKDNSQRLKDSLNQSSLFGYKLQQCSTQKEGLQLLANCKFDIVVVDLVSRNAKTNTIVQKIRRTRYRRPIVALATEKANHQNTTEHFDSVLSISELSPSLIEHVIQNTVDKHNLCELRNALNQQLNLALDAGKLGAWSYSCEQQCFELDSISSEMFGFEPRPCVISLNELLDKTAAEHRDSLRKKFTNAGQDLLEFKAVLETRSPSDQIAKLSLRGRFRDEENSNSKLLVGVAKELRSAQAQDLPHSRYSPIPIPIQTTLTKNIDEPEDNELAIDQNKSFRKVLRSLSNKKSPKQTVENKKFPFDFSRQPTTDFSYPNPSKEGFAKAAKRLVTMTRKGHNIDVSLSIANVPSIEIENEKDFLFTILRELLTNVVKHAQATMCVITLLKDENEWVLQVEDDGIGLDETLKSISAPMNEIGLFTIRTQLALKSGHLDISPASPSGLLARVRLPVCLDL